MIKIENTVTPSGEQWERIIMGLRNPLNSWDKSDSQYCTGRKAICNNCHFKPDDEYAPCYHFNDNIYVLGANDLKLMKDLVKAGTDHRKFMRMIVVYADITAPLYWWKEFDTYKVGTVANSCSTMHKIHSEPISLKDFSFDFIDYMDTNYVFTEIINWCERLRKEYLRTNDKQYWRALIQMLPSSYNQKRTIMLNYEVLANMYKSRKAHKLDEWREFCDWVKTLPYSELITN